MRNTNKKGFTVVELVIVIAVIAILAAVLIPTFSSIISKANLSADQKAVRDMNTVLSVEFASGEPASIKDVIDALDKNGYNVDSLTPLSKNHDFIWNVGTKTIVLVKDGEVVFPKGETLASEHKDLNEDGASFINKEVNNATDLKAALENGNDVTLTGNVENAAEIIIPAGKDVTLDLGGFKYTTTKDNAGQQNQNSQYIRVSAGASLTIQNGTFEGRGIINNGTLTIEERTIINAADPLGGGCIRNKEGGIVTINGGTFVVMSEGRNDSTHYTGAVAIDNAGGTITINGGDFISNNEKVPYLITNNSGTITINDGATFSSNSGVIGVNGGTVTINGGTFTWNHLNGTSDTQYMFYVNGELVLNGGTYVENNERGSAAVGGSGKFTNNTSTEFTK